MKFKQTILAALAIALSVTMLTGCGPFKKKVKESYPEWDGCTVELERFGENNDESKYFIYETAPDGPFKRVLMAYDTASGETKELFRLDDSVAGSISDFITEGNFVYVRANDYEHCYKCDLTTFETEELETWTYTTEMQDYTIVPLDCGKFGTIYFKKKQGESIFYYSFDGENYETLYESRSLYYENTGFYSKNLAFIDGKVYGIISVTKPLHNGSFDASYSYYEDPNHINAEFLFSFDPETKEFETLYKTENKYPHIIGYKDGSIYIYKTGGISKMDAKTGETVAIRNVDVKDAVFGCRGSKIVVYNPEKEEVVDVIDMDKE